MGPLTVMKELLLVKFLLRNKSTSDLLFNKNMESQKNHDDENPHEFVGGTVYLLQRQNLLC